MKKTISIIVICLALVLSVPSVPAYAFNNTFVQYLAGSQDYYTGRLYTVANNVLYTSMPNSNSDGLSSSNYETVNSYLSSNYSGSELLIFGGNLLSTVSSSINLHYFTGVTNGRIFNFGTNSSGVTYASGWVLVSDSPFTFGLKYNVNGGSNISRGDVAYTDRQSVAVTVDGATYYCCSNIDLFFGNADSTITVTPGDSSNGLCLNGNIQSLSYCSIPIYTVYEDDTIANNAQYSRISQLKFIFGDYDLTPLNGHVNAYTSEGVENDYNTGVLPDPEPVVENNSNHMYFKNCDLGFCEPTDIKNFTSFGGAYLYCKYTLDNWVINHINDYQLQFNVVSAIGSEQNNFSYTMRVDRNGFVTIPFSYLFHSDSSSAIPINRGFAAVVTNQKLGPDYNIAHLYSVANSNVPNFIRTLGAEYNYNLTDLGWSALKGGTLKYLCAWVSDGGTVSMNNLAEWSENVAQSFNPYILRVNVKLVSGNDVSGDYAEKFDLYAGDQSTVDTGGLVNNDPFVPDVDQDDGDLPSVPEDPNSTTPSTTVYTGGTFTGNFNGVIGFDPGYRELKQDLDADPDGNFTQYLAPFENNEVGGFVGDFLDDMPTALKSIFIGGFGVLTLLGIYRFIRRG